MMKKVKIISLVSIILISLIGIPSVKHFCDLMGISLSGNCEMVCTSCSHSQKENDSCCSLESESNKGIFITSQGDNCCSDEFILNKVDDEFIVNKNELYRIFSIENISNLSITQNQLEFATKKFSTKETSPPTNLKTEIYISFHSLLI